LRFQPHLIYLILFSQPWLMVAEGLIGVTSKHTPLVILL